MSCRVLHCPREATETLEIPTPGDHTRSTGLCRHHRDEVEAGAEWYWQSQQNRPDMPRGMSTGHLVLMGEDLLTLNEWVVENFDEWYSSLHEAASDDPYDDDRNTWVLTARQRGKPSAQPLRLVMDRAMLTKLMTMFRPPPTDGASLDQS